MKPAPPVTINFIARDFRAISHEVNARRTYAGRHPDVQRARDSGPDRSGRSAPPLRTRSSRSSTTTRRTGPARIADQLAAADPQVEVLHRPGKQGLGAAYLDAFRRALASPRGYGRIVQMDSDFSHDPADVPRLSRALDEGADMALGSRYVTGGGTQNWGLVRRLISRGGRRLRADRAGRRHPGSDGGFKAWKRETLLGAGSRRRDDARVRVPDRDDVSDDRGRVPGRRGSDHVHRPARRPVEDVGADRHRSHGDGLDAAPQSAAAR